MKSFGCRPAGGFGDEGREEMECVKKSLACEDGRSIGMRLLSVSRRRKKRRRRGRGGRRRRRRRVECARGAWSSGEEEEAVK